MRQYPRITVGSTKYHSRIAPEEPDRVPRVDVLREQPQHDEARPAATNTLTAVVM